MKKIIYIMFLFTVFLFSEEKPKGYIAYDYSILSFSETGTNKDFSLKGAKWSLGYTLKKFEIPYLEIEIDSAIELCYISSIKSDVQNNVVSDSTNVRYDEVSARLNELYAAYLKTPLDIGERVDLNLLVGASYSGITLNNQKFTIKNNETTSLSYGIGLEYMLPKNILIHGSFMQYFNNLSSLDVGIGMKF